MSRDHILPIAWNGKNTLFDNVHNLEYMCQTCNDLRAMLNHCWGAVACVRAVAKDGGHKIETIARWWRFPLDTYSPIHMPSPAQPKDPDAERWMPSGADVGRLKKRNIAAIQLGIVVHRVGADEFIFPADSAAKRVWNLATLARGGYQGPAPSDHGNMPRVTEPSFPH